MKKIVILFAALLVLAQVADAQVSVRGYTRRDGTYVQPHVRSNPDGNVWNNYSTRGNTNPYTGQAGTVNPYQQSNSSYSQNYSQPNFNNYNNNDW